MPMPRGLVLLASIWIFGSWMLCIGLRPPISASLASYAPGIRLLLACFAVGLCAGWPLLRLSGPREGWPMLRVLLDLIALLVLFHVVVWPLRLATPWSPARLVLMDAIIFAWCANIGAIIAVTLHSNDARARTLAMAVCIMITVLGLPLRLAAASLGFSAPPAWLQGPVMSCLILGSESGATSTQGAWRGVVALCISAVAAWSAAWWFTKPHRKAVALAAARG